MKDQLEAAHSKLAEGEKIADKAAKLATENVELKASLDEVTTRNLVAEEKLQLLESLASER